MNSGDELGWTCWADWAGPLERAAVSRQGMPLLKWALEQVGDFYGDDWFRRHMERRQLPVMTLADWPLTSPMAVIRLIERAAQIAILDESVRHALTEGPTGIRRSNNPAEFDHLDLLLEVIGLACRAGWRVEVDVPTVDGKIPDLRLAKGTMQYTIEATIRTVDRRAREFDRQHFVIGNMISAIEDECGVELSVSVDEWLDPGRLETLSTELVSAGRRCLETGVPQEFHRDAVAGTAYPAGRRPEETFTLNGPVLGDDMWPRFAQRLHEKARQTEGAGLTWIRIEEYTGLLLLTPAVHWTPEQQLATLRHNIVAELRRYPHVRGVVMSTGAVPDWIPSQREFGVRDVRTGAEALERRLPGARRRRTFVIPVPSGPGLLVPAHLSLDLRRWYGDEPGWLDWALQQVRQPLPTSAVTGELARRLIISA